MVDSVLLPWQLSQPVETDSKALTEKINRKYKDLRKNTKRGKVGHYYIPITCRVTKVKHFTAKENLPDG